MSRNRSLWTLGAVLPIIITLYTDTIHPKAMRRELLLLALLFSSLGLVGQSAQSSSPSSDNPQAGQTQPATLSAPGTGGARNQCGFLTPETQAKVSPGKVSGGKLIHSVRPEYPPDARKAHIQGTVVLCATIAKDGKLRNVRAFSGPEELIPSAIKAVELWRYQPYLKNNEPVDVDSEIHLGFKLSP
jgi:TonB family protein